MTMGKASSSGDKCSTKLIVIFALCVQFGLLFYLNFFNDGNNNTVSREVFEREIASYEEKYAQSKEVIEVLEKKVDTLNSAIQLSKSTSPSNPLPTKPFEATRLEGVALLLMTDQPKWFQRRYSLLIQNLLSNLPSTWKIQIFHPDSKQFHLGVELNPGLKHLLESNHSRVHLTKLPPKLVKARKRPIHLMLHPFVWDNTLAEKVLYLDGNHVLCANSAFRIQDFLQYDYIGAPGWGMFKGNVV